MDFTQLKKINDSNLQRAEAKTAKAQQDIANIDLQTTIVSVVQTLVDFLQGHTSKTVVVNQLRDFATSQDVGRLSTAIDSLHNTLKTHENTDLTPVVDVLNKAVSQLDAIPKEHKDIKIPEQKDYSSQLKAFIDIAQRIESAIKAQETTVEAPVVNVDAPQVTVDAPDLKSLAKDLDKAFSKAIKGIKQPKPTDLKPIVDEQKKTTKEVGKVVKTLKEMPMGGGSSGGGISGGLFEVGRDFDAFTVTNSGANEDTLTYTKSGDTARTMVVTYAAGAEKISDSITGVAYS